MARLLLIFNPAAARADRNVVSRICRVFAREGWEAEVAGTTRSGDAGTIARQGIRDGADRIVVYGGDGTTMQAVEGIVDSRLPIGLIPGGTGNLLAGNLRLPRRPEAAARVAVRGTPRTIDLGRVERDGRYRYFAVACGSGFDADLMAATSQGEKRRWGFGAYVVRAWRLLRRLTPVDYCITADGRSIETAAAMVLVANCREIIPPLCPIRRDIALDDGVLDVAAVRTATMGQALGVLWRMVLGRTERSDRVTFLRGRRVTVESGERRRVELDGEAAGETPFTAEVVPGAMRVVVDK